MFLDTWLLLSPIDPSDGTSACNSILYFLLYLMYFSGLSIFSCRFVRPSVTEQINYRLPSVASNVLELDRTRIYDLVFENT